MLRPSAMHQGEPRKAANSRHGVKSEGAHTRAGDASMHFAVRQAPVWRAAWGRRLTHCGRGPRRRGCQQRMQCTSTQAQTRGCTDVLGLQSVGGRADWPFSGRWCVRWPRAFIDRLAAIAPFAFCEVATEARLVD